MMKKKSILTTKYARHGRILSFRIRFIMWLRYWLLRPLLSSIFVKLDSHTKAHLLNPLENGSYVNALEYLVQQYERIHGPLPGSFGSGDNPNAPIRSFQYQMTAYNNVRRDPPNKFEILWDRYIWGKPKFKMPDGSIRTNK